MDVPFDCSQYLRQQFPALLASSLAEGQDPFVLQVLVPGKPECRVYYALSNEGVQMQGGLAPSPDVTFSVQAPELEKLSEGKLPLDEAMALNHVRLFGDAKKAGRFGEQLKAYARETAR